MCVDQVSGEVGLAERLGNKEPGANRRARAAEAVGGALLVTDGLRIIDDTAPVLGDANRDWFVDQNDLDMVIANWGQSPTAGTGADVNGDGFVGLADLEVLLAQWGEGTPFPGVALVAIPEPTSLALLGLGLLAIRRRRA